MRAVPGMANLDQSPEPAIRDRRHNVRKNYGPHPPSSRLRAVPLRTHPFAASNRLIKSTKASTEDGSTAL